MIIYSMKKLRNRAFTLIELLIVISIISLMSTVVMYSVSEAKISAQDTHKKEEVRQTRNALELYKDGNKDAPRGLNASGSASSYGVAYNENTSEYQSAMQKLVEDNAMPEIPTSPNGRDYFYLTQEGGEGVFGAVLRSDKEIDNNNGCEFSDENYGCSGSAASYAVEFDRDTLINEADTCVSDTCLGIVSGDPYVTDISSFSNPQYLTLEPNQEYTVIFGAQGSEMWFYTDDSTGYVSVYTTNSDLVLNGTPGFSCLYDFYLPPYFCEQLSDTNNYIEIDYNKSSLTATVIYNKVIY